MSDVSRKVVPDKRSLNRERPVTKPLTVHLAQERVFFSLHLNWNGECEKECIQRDMVTGMVAGYHQRNGQQKWLENYPFFYWQPMKCL